MRFAVNKIWYSDKDISNAQFLAIRMKYYKHLDNLELPNNSHLLRYFSNPFFHDSILSQFEFNSLKKVIIIEIIRSEADTEDLNEYCEKMILPKITEKQFIQNPVAYRFEFSGVKECNFKFQENGIDKFWIIGSELDKDKIGYRLTLSQDCDTELSFNFKKSNFKMLNKEVIAKITGGRLKSIPYCNHCKSNLMNGYKIKKHIKRKR